MDGRLPPTPAVVVTLRADFAAAPHTREPRRPASPDRRGRGRGCPGRGPRPGGRAPPRDAARPEGYPDPRPGTGAGPARSRRGVRRRHARAATFRRRARPAGLLQRKALPMSAPRPAVLGRAVLATVLAFGLLIVPADAAPPGPAAAATASSVGRGPAGGAVAALVAAPAGQDPLAAVPADFASMMGYTPVPVRMADGTLRLAKPDGACSAPGGGAPFGFQEACKVHDYGYDLLRYAHAP